MMFTRAILIIFLTLMSFNSLAMSLDEAILVTYKNNLGIKAAKENLKATELKLIEAYSQWLPTIKFGITKNRQTAKLNGQDLASGDNKLRNNSIKVTQPIFNVNGGANIVNVKIAQSEIKVAKQRYIDQEQNIFLKAIESYVNVLQYEEQLRLARKNVEVHEKYLDSITERLNVGNATKSEEARARSRLAQAKTTLVNAQGNISDAMVAFQGVVGVEPRNFKFPNYNIIREPVEELKAIALTKNPRLVISQNEAELASHAKMRSKMGLLPQVYITMEHGRKKYDRYQGSDVDFKIKEKAIAINAEIPIFSAPVYLDMKRTSLTSNAYDNSLKNTHSEVITAIMANYSAYQTALTSLSSNKEAVAAEVTALDGKKQEFEVGTESIIEVLNSENELFKVRNNLIKARGDLVKSYFRIKSIIGALNSDHLNLDQMLQKQH